MSVTTKIGELLAAATSEGVGIGDLLSQLNSRYNDVTAGYPTFTFTLPNDTSSGNWTTVLDWLDDTTTTPFGTAWNRAWAAAKGGEQGFFWLYCMEMVRTIQQGNPALIQYKRKALAWSGKAKIN